MIGWHTGSILIFVKFPLKKCVVEEYVIVRMFDHTPHNTLIIFIITLIISKILINKKQQSARILTPVGQGYREEALSSQGKITSSAPTTDPIRWIPCPAQSPPRRRPQIRLKPHNPRRRLPNWAGI